MKIKYDNESRTRELKASRDSLYYADSQIIFARNLKPAKTRHQNIERQKSTIRIAKVPGELKIPWNTLVHFTIYIINKQKFLTK